MYMAKMSRSNLEMTVPVWHGELTHKQNKAIERVQKLAFEIILNHSYKSYNNALKTLDQETPYQSRTFKVNNFLCLKNILIIQTLVQNLRLQRNSNANQIHKIKSAIYTQASEQYVSFTVSVILVISHSCNIMGAETS